jgi:putative endopeptidase
MRRHWPRIKAIVFSILVAYLLFVRISSALAEQVLPTHGVSVADMDPGADPAADFYRYANGGWLDRTTIPDDFASIETMTDLDGRTRAQLVELLAQRALSDDVTPGSDEWKAIRLFEQGMDLEARNTQGLTPIEPILQQIDAIEDRADLHEFLETSIFANAPGFFMVNAGPDLMDSTETVAFLSGPLIGLPTRDYYLESGPAIDPVREAYITMGADLLALTGRDETEARVAAQAIYDLEAELAAPTLAPEEVEDISLVYRFMTVDELAEIYPAMDWRGYFAALGLDDLSRLVVAEQRYMTALDEIISNTPLPVLKDYLRLQALVSGSFFMDESLEATTFAYYGSALSGVNVIAPLEGRTLDMVNGYLGDALGQLYVDAYFSPEAREQSEELVGELITAFRQRLEANPWMTAETRANALAKLDSLRVKAGYPDAWDDYAEVTIEDSYFASMLSASNILYLRGLAEIGSPVDEEAWPFPPQTVNAMYNPVLNEIIIPAAILQAPLFDAEADPASNFGAIGYIIGHEITHGFDQSGAQFDAEGNLANWWTEDDIARFGALNDEVVEQYEQLEVVDGMFVDGELTIAENVADLGGIQVAYDALQLHLDRHGNPTLDDGELELSQEQRFFIAAATVWRAEIRDEALMTVLLADTHAPAAIRATQPLRNTDAFHDAFDITPGDPMYLAPEERVVIW